jgi:hypothetical protein
MPTTLVNPMNLLSGFGLSGASGLNAYIPLLLVGVMGRAGWYTLASPYDILETWPAIALLTVLLIVEIVVDKVPGADHVNDVVMTVVRPVAGAVLFASSAGHLTHAHPMLMLGIGLISAGGVHATKAVARPVVNATTFGVGAPVVSTVENCISVLAVVLAIFAPILLLALVGLIVWLVVRLMRRLRGRRLGPTEGDGAFPVGT